MLNLLKTRWLMLKNRYRVFYEKLPTLFRKSNYVTPLVAIAFIVAISVTYALGNGIGILGTKKVKEPTPTISKEISTTSPTPTPGIQGTKPKATTALFPTTKPSGSTTASPTSSSRTPNPPIINISYPSSNQSITFTSSDQKLCVVDVPSGGDTSGLQRRNNANNSGWTSYVDIFTLCFTPKEGDNTINLQYKNKYGEESVIYTRQFSFHLSQPTPTTVAGCTPVTFTKLQASPAVIKIDGAWWLSVKSTPNFTSSDFDTVNKSITLSFNVDHGSINIYTAGYEGAPLCQSYSF